MYSHYVTATCKICHKNTDTKDCKCKKQTSAQRYGLTVFINKYI